jgi:hypothetical protein
MNLQESIRRILKEETNKFELVKNFIYSMFDNVRFIEYNTKFNEVMVYYTNHDKRQMLIPTEICEMITNYTGLDVVPYWDTNRESDNQPDFYLDTEEYEEELNESVPSQVKRRHQNFDDMFVAKRKRLICDYSTPEYLFNGLLELTLEDLYFSLFVDSVTYEEWEESVKFIESYLTEKYYDETSRMWESKCKGRIYESEDNEGLYLSMIKDIVDPYKTENGVCYIDVNYDQEDDMYTVMVNFGIKRLNKNFHPVRSLQRNWHVEDIRNKVKNEILGLLPIENIYVGSTAVENCNETINESEDKRGKYITVLEGLTEDFKKEDCVCDIKIEYKPEEEIYFINVILGNLDIDDKFNGVNWRERDYKIKLNTKITKEVFGYLPIPFFVEFKSTPRCSDYRNLQESEEKKPSLVSMIEEHGLHDFISMTGLSIKQIYEKTGALPREVLETYIKDYIENEGDQLGSGSDGDVGLLFSIELSIDKIAESFYLTGGKVSVEIEEYDSNGRKVAGSYERLENLSNEEIFIIVDGMSNWGETEYYEI